MLFILVWAIAGAKKDFGSTRTRRSVFGALNVLTIIVLGFLLQAEFNIARVRDVLQAVDPADIQQMQNQLVNPEVQKWDNKKLFDLKKKDIARVYSKYMDAHKDTPGFHYWNEWFNPVANPGNSASRRAAYLALLLINLVVLICAVWQLVWFRRSRQTRGDGSQQTPREVGLKRHWTSPIMMALALGILIQVFMFPYIYATLGRSFVYPVVKLRLANDLPANSQSKDISSSSGASENSAPNSRPENWTHGVYLVSESDIEFVLYDRLNFLQIKHVPKARVLAMSQLFNASPFESCDAQEMTPCETLWIPEDTSTLDF